MENLKVCILLHFYQPWWQFSEVIHRISEQCYRPILRLVNDTDGFCFTANINLSLLDHLNNNCPDVIEELRKAVQNGKIELMTSTAQHPIMPLVPEFMQRAQIVEDCNKKEERFGIKHNCQGFFFPEMAFSTKTVGLLKSFNYRWTVVDDEPFIALYGKNSVPFNSVISWNGFKVFMRSGRWSNLISSGGHSFEDIKARMNYEIPGWTGNSPAYLILAMDVETFGHHHGHLIDTFLRPMLREWRGHKIIPMESLGPPNFQERSVHYLPDGSWSTSIDDIGRNNPYPLWSSKISRYRHMLWQLVNLALTYFDHAREDCLKITSSCHWWWISRAGWEPDFMQKGATMAMSIIKKHGSAEEVASVQNIYDELMKLRKVFVQTD